MAERKQTPDILGEILSGSGTGDQVPGPAVQSSVTAVPPQPIRTPRPVSAPKVTNKAHWEYLVVSFHKQNGWRARFVNGRELKEWTQGPQLHAVLDQLGADGWELVSVTKTEPLYGTMDRVQAYFKRVKL